MRVFSSFGAWAQALCAMSKTVAVTRTPTRLMHSSQVFCYGEFVRRRCAPQATADASKRCLLTRGLHRQHPHPALHLGGHTIVAHDMARVTQADGLALHDEQPQRMTCMCDQRAAFAARLVIQLGHASIEAAQCLKRGFEPAAKPPKRGGLLLCELVFERRIGGPDVRDLAREVWWSDGHLLQISRQAALDNSFSIAATTFGSVGSTCVAKLAAMCPSRPIRYLWKFQRGNSSGFSAAAHL